ncbi:MAG: YihY/virulence factor BrkB family protein [Bacilli bacterium]
MKKLKEIVHKMYELILRPELKILPGNLAFFLVLAIIPIIILIGFICSLMSIPITILTDFMNQYFPEQISNILVPYFSGQGVDFNVVIFTLMGFILASNGAHAIIIASNKVYNVENNNYIRKRLKAFNMIILLVVLIVFMLTFLAFGSSIMNFLTINFLKYLNKYTYYLYLMIKWPIGFMFIFMIVKLIYTIAPDKHIPSKYVNKGAVFTTIFWIIGTYIYGYYVTNIANYNLFYGNLSNIVILMLWIYFISYVLVIGIVINVTEYKVFENNIEIENDKNKCIKIGE